MIAVFLFFSSNTLRPTPYIYQRQWRSMSLENWREILDILSNRYPKLYFFDAPATKDGKSWFPGYVSIGFFGNGHPIYQFDINEKTGQIVDSMTCKVFDFQDLRVFQRAQ